jgi:hypothetical protein
MMWRVWRGGLGGLWRHCRDDDERLVSSLQYSLLLD